MRAVRVRSRTHSPAIGPSGLRSGTALIRVRSTVNGRVEREFDVEREMTIGRKPPADVVVADGQVSSRHAKIRPDGARLAVTDLGSTNGTRIDAGERLAADAEVPLERGQKLVFGPATL